jgi:hypothetical protein
MIPQEKGHFLMGPSPQQHEKRAKSTVPVRVIPNWAIYKTSPPHIYLTPFSSDYPFMSCSKSFHYLKMQG